MRNKPRKEGITWKLIVKKVMEHLNEIYQCGAKPDGTFYKDGILPGG